MWTAAETRLLLALPDRGDVAPEDLDGFAEPVAVWKAAGRPQKHGLVDVVEETERQVALTQEGLRFRREGLPERRAVAAIEAAGGALPLAALADHLDKAEVPIAIGWLKRKGWAQLRKGDDGTQLVVAEAPPGPDEAALAELGERPRRFEHEGIAVLVERGLAQVDERVLRRIRLTKEGRKVRAGLRPEDAHGEEVTQITPELLARWDETQPRLLPFDLAADVAPRIPGKPHPLTQMITEIRHIFWGMGFQEIAGDYVESAFWNMDALFIPQDHPAREMQDTFYLSSPATMDVAKKDLVRGKAVHETGGGTGSTGWGGRFDADVAKQGLLRTHTTNTTVRYLADAFAKKDAAPAHKVFGIGKVFRNETMDATHLPEFYQIEGIVTEPGADFDLLIGLCRTFFARMGFPEVRFRPAYFPYTEPSMEIEVLHNGKWMELGGCGIFRPEVTEPLGVPHPVIAWGFGLERLAMARLGLRDIRDLYIPDVQWLRDEPLQ